MDGFRHALRFARTGVEHPAVAALVRAHREDLARHSPACSVHALDVDAAAFDDPSLTLVTVWSGEALLGCGALKRHGGVLGELKTMRTVAGHGRRGIGSALLEHLVGIARAEGIARLSLETGRGPAFEPALAFYARHGFVPCPPFADYAEDPFSVFLTRAL